MAIGARLTHSDGTRDQCLRLQAKLILLFCVCLYVCVCPDSVSQPSQLSAYSRLINIKVVVVVVVLRIGRHTGSLRTGRVRPSRRGSLQPGSRDKDKCLCFQTWAPLTTQRSGT